MLAHLRSAARGAGIDMIEYTTQAPEDATDYARSIADDAGAVIVWGGDGTVNEVASGLADTGVPILPCPVGTENLLAKELHIPSGPNKIIDVLQNGRIVSCDAGCINGKHFQLIIGVGFDGEVVHRLTAERTGHISHLSYFWPIWRTFWEHRFPRLRVTADNEEIFDDTGLVFVGNISRYATGLRICRDAHFNDGLLDLVVFSCKRQASLVLHAARTVMKCHPGHHSVIYKQFRHLTIESDRPVPSQVDGDVGPDTPLEISVLPDQIKLIVPQESNGRHFWPWKGDHSK